jgi:hypothetical protein
MAELIAIGYDDEIAARAAADEVDRPSHDPVAVIVRDLEQGLQDALHGKPTAA